MTRGGDGSAEPDSDCAADFEALFRDHGVAVRTFLLRYVSCPAVAEDIVQDLFAVMWEKRAKIEVRGSVRSYLLIAAKRRAINYLRRERVARRAGAGLALRNSGVRSSENEILARVDVQNAVRALSPRSREVLIMHRWRGLTYAEIAESLSISPRTVDTHLERAMDVLRQGALAGRIPPSGT